MAFPLLPPQTLEFARSIADGDLLGILSSANIKLSTRGSSRAAIPRSELEKRVMLMLSDCQRLNNMLPLGQARYPELPD